MYILQCGIVWFVTCYAWRASGQHIGPFVILIDINDLPTVIKHSEVALYADEAVLYYYDSNPAGLECALNADLHAIANWLNDNKFALNVDKNKAMLIGSDSKPYVINLSVSVLDNQLDSVRSFKSYLKWFVGCLPFVRINRLGRALKNCKGFSKISKPTERNGAYHLHFDFL